MNGSITAGRDAQLSQVQTTLGICTSDIAPDDCVELGGFDSQLITSADILSQNINVVAGQAILVTVTLTVAP